jgi:hypothetical protein
LLGVVIIITQAKKCMENNFTNIDMDEIWRMNLVLYNVFWSS